MSSYVFSTIRTVGVNGVSITHEYTTTQCCYRVFAFANGMDDSIFSPVICGAVPMLNVPIDAKVN